MKIRKKVLCEILGLALSAAMLTGCRSQAESGSEPSQADAAESAVQPSEEASVPESTEDGSLTDAAEENSETQAAEPGESLVTNGGESIALSSLEHRDDSAEAVVYYISDISPEAMVEIYETLGVELAGEKIAVKLSTGEPPASNYLDPNLIADLVHKVDGTIVENNTAYGGQRASTAMHYQVAEDHGFTEIADFVVLDEDGSVSLPVEGGTQLTENLVAPISQSMTDIWCFPILKDTPWQALEVPSKISLSDLVPRRASV